MILVTGASGLLGSHLVDALVARGDAVRALVQPNEDASRLKSQGSEEATLKRAYTQGKQCILQADNPKYPPVVVPARELKIVGKVLKGNYTL